MSLSDYTIYTNTFSSYNLSILRLWFTWPLSDKPHDTHKPLEALDFCDCIVLMCLLLG